VWGWNQLWAAVISYPEDAIVAIHNAEGVDEDEFVKSDDAAFYGLEPPGFHHEWLARGSLGVGTPCSYHPIDFSPFS